MTTTAVWADDVKQKVSLGVFGAYQNIGSKDKNSNRDSTTGRTVPLLENKKTAHGAKVGAAFLYDFVFESLSVGFGLDASYAFGCEKSKETDPAYVLKNVLKPGFQGAATVRLALPNEAYNIGFTPYVRFGVSVAQFKTTFSLLDDPNTPVATYHSKKATKWKVGPTAGLGVSKDFGPCALQFGYDFAYYGKMQQKHTIGINELTLKKERLMTHTVSLGVMFPL
ncbi:MAG: hypothetical protein V6Z78_04250 [Holosporaceae bacterium]